MNNPFKECFLAIEADSGHCAQITDENVSKINDIGVELIAKTLGNLAQNPVCVGLFDGLKEDGTALSLNVEAKIEIADGKKVILAHIRYDDTTELRENEGRLEVIEGHLIDIVERENTKKADKERAFTGIFETISAGVAILDDKGFVLDINKRLISIFELEEKQKIIGTHFSKHLSPSPSKEIKFLCDPNCPLSDNKGPDGCSHGASQREFEYITASKKTVNALLSIACFKNKESKTNFIYSITNITTLKEIEKKQKESEKLLLARSRMADMGEMIGAIAHQWRQPLNTLGLLVQDVPYSFKSKELTTEYIMQFSKNSMEQIAFMSKTIDDFRNFFRADKRSVNFSLSEYVKNSLFLVQDMYRARGIEITIIEEANPIANGFPNEFSQVVLNIASNAKDALETSNAKRKKITVAISKDDSYGIVSIQDNGGGIDEAIIKRIFDPYFTTKPEGKGTGIGLYMSKTIIEEHMQGSLSVQNHEDGALFIIKIILA